MKELKIGLSFGMGPGTSVVQVQSGTSFARCFCSAHLLHLQWRCWAAPVTFLHKEERTWENRSLSSFNLLFKLRGSPLKDLKINVWPAALSRTCSFKTGQWFGRIGGCDLSDAAAGLLTEGDKSKSHCH